MEPANIREQLRKLSTYDDALDLFGELGYTYAGDDPVYRDNWPESTRDLPIAELKYLAHHQSDFAIIYCQLEDERLPRTVQRPIIERIARQHPFFMLVFRNRATDPSQATWKFVNVRPKQGQNGRLIRRITIGPAERLHDRLYTAAQRLALIDISRQPSISAIELQALHDRAFDVEAVTNAFFATYRAVFEAVENSITGITGEARRLFTQRLFNRLMFIVFLEHKGWLNFNNRPDYLYALWEDYQNAQDPNANFYRDRLQLLFFAGLNTPNEVNVMRAGGHDQGMLQRLIGNVPYLNGGLFDQEDEDKNPAIVVPDAVIGRILNELFYHYNFTVMESTPQEIEVAVDPEMLGRIFEELVTGRHETGSYYTPKPVVSFMGREALKGYLQHACPGEHADALAAFVDQHEPGQLSDPEGVLDALKSVRICDPACGSGAYLLGMLHELIDLRAALFATKGLDQITIYQRKLEIIQNNLYGVDIDLFAVNIARLRLWLSLIVEFEGNDPPPLPNLDFKIETGDSLIAPDPTGGLQPDLIRYTEIQKFLQLKADYLTAHGGMKRDLKEQIDAQKREIASWARKEATAGFDWAVEFAEVFHNGADTSGFDIVLANPPYVRQELIKDYKPALKRAYSEFFTGRTDLYVYFYLRALQLLKSGGMLVFISSNKWMRAGYGENLRRHLATHTTIHSLVDFGDLPLFGAIAYPVIVVARKQEPLDTKSSLQALVAPSLDVLNDLGSAVTSAPTIAQGFLRPDGWQLSDTQTLELMEKLRTSGVPLGDYVGGRFFMGVKTGLNNAFVIDQATRDKLIAEDPRSAEIIKPWLRGRDVRRWAVDWQGFYIIFTYHGIDIGWYPAVETYLLQFKQALLNRATSANHKWYELQQPQMGIYPEFDKSKIVYPDIGRQPEFALDTERHYIGNTLYCIPEQGEFLLGILNSQVVEFFYSQVSTQIQHGYFRFIAQYMEQIPIPNVEISLRTKIETIARELLALRGQGPRVAELENELNRLVCQAYHLTTAEIALIERETHRGKEGNGI